MLTGTQQNAYSDVIYASNRLIFQKFLESILAGAEEGCPSRRLAQIRVELDGIGGSKLGVGARSNRIAPAIRPDEPRVACAYREEGKDLSDDMGEHVGFLGICRIWAAGHYRFSDRMLALGAMSRQIGVLDPYGVSKVLKYTIQVSR
jgi:hypothetical protein